MNTKGIGERSEGMILAALLLAEKIVLKPFGDNQRYDLVVDEDGEFFRVQCKTGRLIKGAILFNTCSMHCITRVRKNYRGAIEYFGVYCPELGKSYLVPVQEVPLRSGSLRVDDPKNGQLAGTRKAEDFEIKTGMVLRK